MINYKFFYYRDPFPYIIYDKFLDSNELSFFNKIKTDNIKKDLSNENKRINLDFSNPQFNKISDDNNILEDFKKKISSKKFFNFLLSTFEKNLIENNFNLKLKNYHLYIGKNINVDGLNFYEALSIKIFNKLYKIKNFFLKLLNIPSIRVDIKYAATYDGYEIRPHKDQVSKIFFGLIYLNTMKDESGKYISSLNLFKRHDNKKKQINVNPEDNEIFKFSKVNIDENKAVIILNTPFAYHSVDKFKSNYLRKFIYFSFAITNFKNFFNEK